LKAYPMAEGLPMPPGAATLVVCGNGVGVIARSNADGAAAV